MAKVECPRCRGKIDSRAVRCQHCQADFTPEEIAVFKQEERSLGVGCLVVIGIFLALILIGQMGDTGENTSSSEASESNTPASPATQDGPSSNWSYSRSTDPVRNGEVITATIDSENATTLDFPYGTVKLHITIRQHPEWGKDVIFRVDEGQINCGYRDCAGMINFDGRSEKLTLNESADHDASVVFAAYDAAIINKLKNSTKVIVELPFFQNGNRQFTFETEGLEWPPQK